MTTILPLVPSSLELKLPVSVSTKYHQLPAMTRAKTIWEACLFRARPSVALKRIENGDIMFLTERDWSQERCHSNGTIGVILFLLRFTLLVPSLKITAPMFLEIFLIQYFTIAVYFVFNFLICILRKH